MVTGKMRKNEVCILFSGGSDSSLTAYKASKNFEKVHLLTYKHFGQTDVEKSKNSFAILDKKFPSKFIHLIINMDDLFTKIYNKDYIKNVFKYRTLQIQFACFACQAGFHINTIIYCLKNNIHNVWDGANTEYEEASPMQIEIVKKEIKKLYAEYGINHDSPIYNEHKIKRSDHQLYELGLRPQKNIKDDHESYIAYQGYCKFMPGGVAFLNYRSRCPKFPQDVQGKILQHWLENVDFFKEIINSNLNNL